METNPDTEVDPWIVALTAAGHVPIMRPGCGENATPELDEWVLDSGFHNGPGCGVCGDSWCMHCTSLDSPLTPCIGKAGVIEQAKATIERLTAKLAELERE